MASAPSPNRGVLGARAEGASREHLGDTSRRVAYASMRTPPPRQLHLGGLGCLVEVSLLKKSLPDRSMLPNQIQNTRKTRLLAP